MSRSSFLLIRTSPKTKEATYYFNRRVPTKLTSIIGQDLWRETLNTSDRAQAERLARQRTADTDVEIARAMLEHSRLRSLRARLTPEERERIDEASGPEGFRTTVNQQLRTHKFIRAGAELLTSAASNPKWGTRAAHDEVVAEADAATTEASAVGNVLARNRSILSRAGHQPDDVNVEDDEPAATPDSLYTVIDRWAKETGAPSQHVEQYRYPVDRFYQLHGPVPLKTITKAHLREFQDALAKLPRSTRKDVREATLQRAIAIAEKEDLPRIESRTVAKHLSAVATLLRHAMSWGYVETNPAEGYRVLQRRQKVASKARRLPFTVAQMRALEASLGAEYKQTDDDYWVPIVAAYQGCRIEEVVQLLKSDIYQDPATGVWCVSITDAGEGQKVKNVASKRIIPLHPSLIERGLLAHLERSPGPRVFATLKPDQRGRFGGPYGKRFSRHLRKRTKVTDPAVTFHSLRHRWKDAADNAGLPGPVRRFIEGHQNGNAVESGYGVGFSLDVLAPWMAKVQPFDG